LGWDGFNGKVEFNSLPFSFCSFASYALLLLTALMRSVIIALSSSFSGFRYQQGQTKEKKKTLLYFIEARFNPRPTEYGISSFRFLG
jgi:hypothetical protein